MIAEKLMTSVSARTDIEPAWRTERLFSPHKHSRI